MKALQFLVLLLECDCIHVYIVQIICFKTHLPFTTVYHIYSNHFSDLICNLYECDQIILIKAGCLCNRRLANFETYSYVTSCVLIMLIFYQDYCLCKI